MKVESPPDRAAPRTADRRPLFVLGAAMIAAAALLLWLGRGTGYLYDEWYYWASYHPIDLSTLLHPGNGNLVLVPVALYKAVMAMWGTAYVPYRVIEVSIVLIDAVLFYLVGSAGDRTRRWLALGPAVLLLFFGSSWDTVDTPLGIPTLLGIGFGLGAMLAVERNSVKADLLTLALLCVGLASFTTAVPFAVGVGVVIIFDGGPRRWTRMLVPTIPLVAYAVYRWHYRDYPTIDGAKVSLSHILSTPESLLNSSKAALGSMFGLHYKEGIAGAVALALVALLAIGIVYRFRMEQRVDRRAFAYVAGLLVLWLSLAALGKDPLASRYQYPAAVLLFAFLIEMVRGLHIPNWLGVVAVAALCLAVVANVIELDRKRNITLTNTRLNRAKLAALEIIRNRVPDNFGLQYLANPEGLVLADIYVITAGQYFEATARDGSPGMSAEELLMAGERQREAADRLLFNGLQLGTQKRRAPMKHCRPVSRHGLVWSIRSGPLWGGGFGIRAGEARVRAQMLRYAGVSTTYPIRFPPRSGQWLAIPTDRSQVPWRVSLSARRPFDLCLARRDGVVGPPLFIRSQPPLAARDG